MSGLTKAEVDAAFAAAEVVMDGIKAVFEGVWVSQEPEMDPAGILTVRLEGLSSSVSFDIEGDKAYLAVAGERVAVAGAWDTKDRDLPDNWRKAIAGLEKAARAARDYYERNPPKDQGQVDSPDNPGTDAAVGITPGWPFASPLVGGGAKAKG